MLVKIYSFSWVRVVAVFLLPVFIGSCSIMGMKNEKYKPVIPKGSPVKALELLESSDLILGPGVMVTPEQELLIPEGVSQDLIYTPIVYDRFSNKRVTISAINQDVKTFFLSLGDSVGANIVVHPQLSGLISMQLKEVSLDHAFKAMRDMYGYDYIKKPYGYYVLPSTLQTQVFHLDYLNIVREGSSSTLVSTGHLTNDADSGGDIKSTNITTTSNANFWQELNTILAMMLNTNQTGPSVDAGAAGLGASYSINPQAGIVVVKALPQDLQNVASYLQTAEERIQRQVILEAKIIEVELNDGYQAGINWKSISDADKGTRITTAELKDETLLNSDLIGGVFSLAVDTSDFDGVISLLETQGNVNVLSSPRIATINNQKAVIKVGQDEFFVTEFKTTTSSSALTPQTDQDVTLTPFFSGIVLDVTPQIGDDGKIILHVHPTVSEVVDQTKVIDIGSENLILPVALSSIRESDSIVKAKNNQIVVIGGLLKSRKSDVTSAVPFLSKIPVFGKLFLQERQSTVKSELVILLRPVVSGVGDWGKEYDDQMKDYSLLPDEM